MPYRRPVRPAISTARARRRLRRLTVESLEDRQAPAIFTGAGPDLTIDLNNPNEVATFSTDGTTVTVNLTGGTADTTATGGNVTGGGTATATFASATYNGTIFVLDAAVGNSVAFANSTGAYLPQFNVTLNDPASGNITFAGSSTFNRSVTGSTTAGRIASDLASAVTMVGGGSNLNLTATGHDVLLAGAVTVGGTTRLAANVVQADSPANDFVGALALTGPAVASIFDINNLTLATSTLAFGTLAQTTRITANGNITQAGVLTVTGTSGTLAVASTGGAIALTSPGNNISANVALGLSVTGANTATVVNTAGLALGDVALGTGALTLTAAGSIIQMVGTTVQTDGPVSLTVSTNNSDILLGNAGNRIAGAINVTESGVNFLRDFSLRNAFDNATPPTGTAFTTAGDIRDLTLFFDNNGVALPGYAISGNLSVTAGGDVTQTAALAIPGTTTVTVLSDFGIGLSATFNALAGAVSLNDPQSTQPVDVENNGTLTLGDCNLGRGTFFATASTGNITQVTGSGIVQEKGAGPAAFTVLTGTNINLNKNGNNQFPGRVLFGGALLSTVSVRNADFQAVFGNLAFPVTVNALTVHFVAASIVLPSLTLTNLAVNAQGIVQAPGSALTVSGQATFNANTFPINLSNSGNDFTNLRLLNSGRNDVTVVDVDDVTFTGNSTLGTGRLTVTAGGNIAEPGSMTQANTGPAGDVRFTSTGSITLTGANTFRGPVSVAVAGANTASVISGGATLTLGAVTTGTGAFVVGALASDIIQDPNSVLTCGGPSSFNAAGSFVFLTNRTNTFGGSVTLNAAAAGLRATGPVVLAASSVPGSFSVKTGGTAADSITQTGPITGGGSATFDAGAGSVILTNAGNDFASVSVVSIGSAVSITDANALNVGNITVGGGTLTLTTGGDLGLAGATSGIVQTTVSGTITLNTPAGSNITLKSPDNVFRGTVNVLHATDVTVQTKGDLTFTAGSAVSGSLSVSAGGTLTLPATLNLSGSLDATADSTPVGNDITAGGQINFVGAVPFTGSRALTAGGVNFNGDVTAGGPLTFNLPASESVRFNQGTWDQGANALTINGTIATFQIGGLAKSPARLVMAGATLSMPGNGNVTVLNGGTFEVGINPAASEKVFVANGTGGLHFFGTLAVGFGAVNDELVKTGDGVVLIEPPARLVGSGLAGATAAPVLESQTALISGRFANSADVHGNPHDFFAGSDIVTPAYSFVDVSVKAGGVAAPSGTATGTLPDGDRFTVKSSLGSAAGLATVVDLSGNLDVVVRNATAAAASTLTFSALGGGDGQLSVGGVAVHNPGSVTVTAQTANFFGDFTTAGTLTALTARDLGNFVVPFLLTGGGPTTGATSLTARVVRETTLTVPGPLKMLKAVLVGDTRLTARSFGTLSSTGLAAAGIPGNFFADLSSTTPATGLVLTSATIAGTLTGTWDLRGSVGTVKAFGTTNWHLGTVPRANTHNGGLLTGATALALGPVSSSTIDTTGAVATMTASDIQDSNFTAGSWGTVQVVGNPALVLVGNVSNSTLTATGNAAGVGLKGLTVAGDLANSTVRLLNGDATAISVGRTISASTVVATDSGTRGALTAITAGQLHLATIDARSVGTVTVKGNLAAGLFGDVSSATVRARGNTAGVGLGTFSASNSAQSLILDVQSGNLTKVVVGRQLGATSIVLTDPTFGALGSIQAGDWGTGVTVLAKTIGTAASVGAAAVLPASQLLPGRMDQTKITAYQNSGTTPAIGSLITKGDFSGSSVVAERGIGSVTVGHTVANSFLIADDIQPGAPNVGLVKTLTVGAVNTSTVATTTLGTVKVTGFSQPEGNFPSFVFGDVSTGSLTAAGGGAGVPGIASLAVAGRLTNSRVQAPFGIKTLTAGQVVGPTQIVADNPVTPAAGVLTSVTVGELGGSTVRGGSIGTLKVTGNVAAGLLGNIVTSTISATSTAAGLTGPKAIGSLTVTGDIFDGVIDAPATVGSITVGGRVRALSFSSRIQAGYNTGAKIGSLTAGAWGQSELATTTDLVTQAVGTFTLKGNAARGFVGTTDRGFIDILGSAAGVGLGTFTANGTATDSLFRVSDGDVGSFTVLRFLSSDLLVGFRPVKGSDITLDPAAANWAATNHKIGSFTTTAPFDPADPTDSASFRDSNVVAAILGTVTLSGVDPTDPDATTFGVAFRTGAGAGAKGTVKKGGVTLAVGAVDGQFNYLGLPG